jgi:hypothetical protein
MATTLNRPDMSSNRTGLQKVTAGVGGALMSLGALGIMMPGFLGMHLSLAHNIIYLTAGAVALWSSYADEVLRSYVFCMSFGVAFGLIGAIGFLIGQPGFPSVGQKVPDTFLIRVIPNVLEFGTNDHGAHIFIGLILMAVGLTWRNQNKQHIGDQRRREDLQPRT